jgi:hypothetical protein
MQQTRQQLCTMSSFFWYSATPTLMKLFSFESNHLSQDAFPEVKMCLKDGRRQGSL